MLNANMANVKQLFRGRKVTGTFEKRARARQQCQQCNKTVLNQLPVKFSQCYGLRELFRQNTCFSLF